MRYLGGKTRIAKRLAKLLQPEIDRRGAYAEPFVGSAAVLAQVRAPIRLASDINAAMIWLWKALDLGWQPPKSVTEDDYNRVKEKQQVDHPLTAFVGIGCSHSGKWFGGYARDSRGDDYVAQATNSLLKALRTLDDVIWRVGDYRAQDYPAGCVIYCDPPYAGTTGYAGAPPFDHEAFWQFCREKHAAGHAVFVSEYAAPPDFGCVLEIPTRLGVRSKSGAEPRIERLFQPMTSVFA